MLRSRMFTWVCICFSLARCDQTPAEQMPPNVSVFEFEAVKVVYNTLKYVGVSESDDGVKFIVFELTNPRDSPICVQNNQRKTYFGEIDYFSARDDSYRRNTSTEISLTGDLDANRGVSKFDTYSVVMPNQTLIIKRNISLDMFPYGNGLFNGSGPFFAELEIRDTFECIPEDVVGEVSSARRSWAMLEGNFTFLSGRVGPFYLK